jgi:stage II sporulation protein R
MKNKIITAYFLLLSFATIFSIYIPKSEGIAKEEIVIPNEAIRLRILANSDSKEDQALKRKVRDAVNAEITKWVEDLTSIEEARAIIQANIPEIQRIAEEVVARENANQTVKAEFDKVKFPTKLYGQFLYPAGEYEAILITLGEGKGANWWCVLYPPLCFLDFSNGVAVSDGIDEPEEPVNTAAAKQEEETPKETPETKETSKVTKDETEPDLLSETANQEVSKQVPKQQQSSDETRAADTVQEDEQTEKSQPETEKAPEEKTTKENQDKVAENKEQTKESAPVYTGNEDEQEVEVKFFIKEVWKKFF